MSREEKNRVHLIFKTHLDIGFTDTAERVVRRYFREFIPGALETARSLRGSDTPFVWTTGSWLIDRYLREADAEGRRLMEEAISRGEIAWHALPYTSHTEAAGPEVFAAGLEISRRLDRRFGRTTVAAKMTDVPGHTLGIIPPLVRAGVTFLHIGINQASHPAELPPLFRWRHPGGEEILVNYQATYGARTEVPGVPEILCFFHKNDNIGPPGIKEVRLAYRECRSRYPRAEVSASTLDRFALCLRDFSPELPVITREIGDTWIHGIGSDPLKVARFRRLARLAGEWRMQPEYREEAEKMAEALGLVTEHTWGLDMKTYFPVHKGYGRRGFRKLRARDPLAADPVLREKFTRPEGRTGDPPGPAGAPGMMAAGTSGVFRRFRPADPAVGSAVFLESSWEEQNRYLNLAAETLTLPELKVRAAMELAAADPPWPELSGFRPCGFNPDPGRSGEESWGRWGYRRDSGSGALKELRDRKSGRYLIRGGEGFGLFSYRTFCARDYRHFYRRYIRPGEPHQWWALQDFTKPGLEKTFALSGHTWFPRKVRFLEREEQGIRELAALFTMPLSAVKLWGAPAEGMILYRFFRDLPLMETELRWRRKEAVRIPEALWISFGFLPGNPGGWTMDKMGTPVSPFDVVSGGNRALHALGEGGLRYAGNSSDPEGPPSFRLETPDAPLVSPGRPRILEFDQEPPDLFEGFSVNLYNNLWGTNFPMWYGRDGFFRFRLRLEESAHE